VERLRVVKEERAGGREGRERRDGRLRVERERAVPWMGVS
jgi:hypothetical protein